MIDNISSLYRADWFDENGQFDYRMLYAWGIDLEMSWKARDQGRSLWVCEDTRVKKVTDIGYTMDRMSMSADDRSRLASDNMREILYNKYGSNWNWKMRREFVELGWL